MFLINDLLLFFSGVSFIYLAFRPHVWWLFVIIHFLHSLNSAQQPEDILMSCLMYAIGCVIAFSSGFFTTHLRLKLSGAVMLLLSFMLLQLRLSVQSFAIAILSALFTAIAFIVSFVLLGEYLKNLLPPQVQPPNPENKELDLAHYFFSPKELQCIYYAANGVTYKEMSSFMAVSESVIKKTMIRIFATFGIKTREQFSLIASQFSFSFPEDFKVPEIYPEKDVVNTPENPI